MFTVNKGPCGRQSASTNMVPRFPAIINQLFTTCMYVYTRLCIGEMNTCIALLYRLHCRAILNNVLHN